jgi:hypothetical protein
MVDRGEPATDLAGLVVPLAGRLVATGDSWEPYQLLDSGGAPVDAVRLYFGHLQAAGRPEPTVRSYGLDVLRWFRFLWAAGVCWDQATPCRGPGLLPVAGSGRQAGPPALARPAAGTGSGWRGFRAGVRGVPSSAGRRQA